MLIAQVKLPVAIKRDIFNKLSQAFECIQENPEQRVYEQMGYGSIQQIEVCLMGSKDVYEDECEQSQDGGYIKDGQPIDSYCVRQRPIQDYVVLKERFVILDVDKFYTITSQVGLEIIKSIPIDFSNLCGVCKQLETIIKELKKKMDTINVTFKFK